MLLTIWLLYNGAVQSIHGANVQSCCERYGVTMHTLLGNSFVGQTIDDICKRRLTSETYGRAMAVLELLMINRGVLDVSECHFSGHHIDVINAGSWTLRP